MSMIQIENLTFSYPGSHDNVFEDVSFQIDTQWRLGFVGRNGRGKTTLLQLLMGAYEYSGRILSSVKFDYFPYPVADRSQMTEEVLSEVCPAAEEWEIIRELSYLEVDAQVLRRPFETLSNGEQTKVLLAALFLNQEHFLLIDEPTNHLDLRAREMVSAYLKRKKGFILVSHDRKFLDGCIDHVLSLNRTDITVQSGNFSSFLENFERQMRCEEEQNERLRRDIGRLQQAAKRSAVWSDRVETSKIGAADKGFVGHRAAKMMKRSKSIEARKQQAIEEKSALLKNLESSEALKLSALRYHADCLLSFSRTAVCFDGKAICAPVSFTLRRAERIALDGKNGSGKSSLLKLITGQTLSHTGSVCIGSGLRISYVAQDTSQLCGPLKYFTEQSGIDDSLFRAVLRKMGFERVQFEKDLRQLSEGQKKKLLLARSLCEQAHVYVWDEPLNFIDIYSRMQIERLIREFSPTMIFAEHDRAFRDAIATKIIPLGQ